MQTLRKCNYCKDNVVLEERNFILEKGSYFHYQCYIDSLVSKKRKKYSLEDAQGIADQLKEESLKGLDEKLDQEKLYRWVQKQYDVVVLPGYFFMKMKAIYDGTFKGMSKGIPAKDMLDMWQRKWNDLVNLYAYNVGKGKNLDTVGRINYDLAVLLAKAESYYKWKESQKDNQEIIKEIGKTKRTDFTRFKSVEKSVSEDYIVDEEV